MDHRSNVKPNPNKSFKKFNVNLKTIIILEENRKKSYDLELGKEFLSVIPEAQFIKEQIDTLDVIKTKNFCSLKDS